MSARVLVLEDDLDVGLITETALGAEGFDVEVVPSVERALLACEQSQPDLALVDVQLPDHSGWDFVRHVREGGRWREMQIVVYTVHSNDPDQIRRAVDWEVDALLSKSGDLVRLVRDLRRILEQRAASA